MSSSSFPKWILFITHSCLMGFHGGSDDKESTCNVGDLGLIPGLGRFPWRRAWLPTPVFLLGESHGPGSLVGYSPGGTKNRTRLSGFHFHFCLTALASTPSTTWNRCDKRGLMPRFWTYWGQVPNIREEFWEPLSMRLAMSFPSMLLFF